MLDGKVLTAVLTTLAAVATAINAGPVQAEQLKDSTLSAPGDLTFNKIFPDSLTGISDLFKNPKPENDLKASLTVEDISDESFRVKDARLVSSNFSSLNFLGKKAVSDEDISLYGFDGKVVPGRMTRFEGSINGFYTSGVNVSGSMSVSKEFKTSKVVLENVVRSQLKVESAKGVIRSNSSSTDLKRPTKVSINSFSGDLVIYPFNQSIVLNGKVDRLEAGNYQFGR